jgi:hypothetical protein
MLTIPGYFLTEAICPTHVDRASDVPLGAADIDQLVRRH